MVSDPVSKGSPLMVAQLGALAPSTGGILALDRLSFGFRVTVVGISTAVAFHQSVVALINAHAEVDPLSYSVLALPLALVLMAVLGPRDSAETDINDRSIDAIVGLALLAISLMVLFLLPVADSVFYWDSRLDLLSMPAFVAGSIALVFGVRALWRVRAAVLMLAAACPLPYLYARQIGIQQLGPFTAANVPMAGLLNELLSSPGLLWNVLNDVFGALLVLIAIAIAVRGGWFVRLAWTTAGLVLVSAAALIALSIANLFSVAATPANVGFVGLALGVAVAAVSSGGRRRPRPPEQGARPEAPEVRRAGPALAAVLTLGLLAGILDAGVSRYERVADGLGVTRIESGTLDRLTLPGWTAVARDSHRWGAAYLDRSATWSRYTFEDDARMTSATEGMTFTVDVISTADLAVLSATAIDASYQLQRKPLVVSTWVDLGSGVIGHQLTYRIDEATTWNALYWQWPVLRNGAIRYERIVVSAVGPLREESQPSVLRPASADPSLRLQLAAYNLLALTDSRDSESARVRQLLMAIGRDVVATGVGISTDGVVGQ